ncbi:hypothetical protein ABPG72_020457 [Tetrahymena utriculariae]
MIRNTLAKTIWKQVVRPYNVGQSLFKTNMYQFSQVPPTNSSSGIVNSNMDLNQKIEALEKSQPFFDRIMFFDPDIMANLPGPLQKFDPIVEAGKDMLVYFHDLGLPWWSVISVACILLRSSIMPLIYVQFKRTSKLASIAPVLIQVKKLADQCQVSRSKRIQLIATAWFQIIRQQKLKMLRLFVYNLVNIPIIITMVWSIRRTMVEETVKNTSFLWIPSFIQVDPYFVLPVLAIAGYYWNLQRFITPENKHTLISKIRGIGQILLILWLPLLSNWPALIQWYIFNNALYSIIQTTLITHPSFIRFVEPKMLLYQFILKTVEYDKIQSETLIESIKSGEESYKDKSISEEILVAQMEEVLRKLNAENIDETMEDVREYTENDLKF